MARKPTKSKAKSTARRAKPQRHTRSSHAKSHTKRTVAKHKSRKSSRRFSAALVPLTRLMKATFSLPRMGIELPLLPTFMFVAVLGLAVGAGYWGAKSMFGRETQTVTAAIPAPPKVVIQQTQGQRGVILPEPNGAEPHQNLAYEEKALEEVYEPTQDVDAPVSPPRLVSKPGVEQGIKTDDPKPNWLRNALAYTPPVGAPMIAIVIDDMGVDRKRSKRMWQDVPAPLTLSFMTYANDLPEQTQAAKLAGHELMLHMSMEPSSTSIDAGPNVLMTAMPESEVRSLVNWGMDRFDGFVAVNNHMGSRFTEDETGMRVVLEEIEKRGLFFLDSRTSNRTVGPKIARQLGMPVLQRNVFLDNENIPEKVLKQLDEVERLARKNGQAIAIGHPRDSTINVLKSWIPQAQDRGLAIVPISTLMFQKLKAAQERKVLGG